jgi:hypothetical protein
MRMTYPYRLNASILKGFIGSAAPVAFALLPLIRRRMGWKIFSLPGIVLFGGLWLLEKKTRNRHSTSDTRHSRTRKGMY